MYRLRLTGFVHAVTLISCSRDDPTSQPHSLWSDETLPQLPANSALLDLDFQGSNGAAVGAVFGTGTQFTPILLTTATDTWTQATLTPPVSNVIFSGVTVVGGKPIAVGASIDNGAATAILYDGRTETWVTFPALPSEGTAFNAVAQGDGVVWAVGVNTAGLAARSTAPGVWELANLGLIGTHEAALNDILFAPETNTFLGCGWNDGGPPYDIVLHNTGAGWGTIDGAPSGGNNEFLCVWGTSSAALWVGGSAPVGDGSNTQAMLVGHTDNDWFEVVLPDASRLEAVNDLVRVDNDFFMACGTNRAIILGPGDPGPTAVEFDERGRALALSLGVNAVYAVVSTTSDGEIYRSRILKRTLDN